MRMDDPWGSPWADDSKLQNPAITIHENKALGAPVKASNFEALEKLTTVDSLGNLATEDCGGWAEIPGATVPVAVDFDTTADEWKESLAESDGANKINAALPVVWDIVSNDSEDQDQIRRGTPTIRRATNYSAQLCQDPWANGVHSGFGTTDKDNLIENNRKKELNSLGSVVKSIKDKISTENHGGPFELQNNAKKGLQDLGREDVSISVGLGNLRPNSESGNTLSRPPSPSEHSQHDDPSQVSPCSSNDEDTDRSKTKIKNSTEIKGLSSGTTQAHEGNLVTNQATDENYGNEFDDFGDFEDVPSHHKEAQSPHALPKTLSLKMDCGTIEFNLDLALQQNIFPDLATDISPEKIFIPDGMPHNCFSSIGERKMWYRISRYEPMRKYNAGEDENYARVNWQQSEIRGAILGIVERWIEEDRMGSHVAPGVVNKGIAGFGWGDAIATPVSLDQAFASKTGKKKNEQAVTQEAVEIPREWPKGLVGSRSLSKSRPSTPKTTQRRYFKPSPKVDSKAEPADFSWSSGSASTSGKVKSALTRTNIEEVSAESVMVTKLSALLKQAPVIKSPDFSAEDEWGEMVSPLPVYGLALPPSHSLRDNKSQTLGGSIPLSAQSCQESQQKWQPLPVGKDQNSDVPQESWASASGRVPVEVVPGICMERDITRRSNPTRNTVAQQAPTQLEDIGASTDSLSGNKPSLVQKSISVAGTKITKSVSFDNLPEKPKREESKKSPEELELDRKVRAAVNSLPDLSYMLRR